MKGKQPQPLRVAVLGFGKVAQALCVLLAQGHGQGPHGDSVIELAAVAGRRRGLLYAAPGTYLDAGSLAEGGAGEPWRPWPAGGDGISFAREVAADVLVELTTLDVRTGQPAISHVEAALRSGKHVVTANKGPVAWDYARLAALAASAGRRFLFEAAVMDGAPVFNLHRYCLRGCTVTGIRGILNSTTNVILTAMDSGACFEDALAEAQRLGIAEADPALDVDGWDAAAKLCALSNVLMGATLTPCVVAREGIRGLTVSELAQARQQGETVRLVAEASRGPDGTVVATVRPARVSLASSFGQVQGTSSILTIETDLLGKLTITEEAPQLPQTAYGVLADLLEIAAGR